MRALFEIRSHKCILYFFVIRYKTHWTLLARSQKEWWNVNNEIEGDNRIVTIQVQRNDCDVKEENR